jgi:hypothetical protein
MIVPLIQKENTILVARHAASQTRPHTVNMNVQPDAQTARSHNGHFLKDNHCATFERQNKCFRATLSL